MEPIVIQRDTYRAEVDPGRDALVSLLVGERQTELLKAPWVFRRPGPDGIRPAVVMESPLGTEVVIGFETAELTGATRYTFFHHGSLIEISRRIAPKHRLTLRGVNEGCALSQRGGTFALQAGVGGPVQRGELRDGKTYRDLLFGYLGERPRPDNADKCGWFDFSWPHEYDAGLGVVVARRWRDAATKSYDVTRYYDAADWVQVNYVWGVEIAIDRPQESVVYLAPHGFIDLADAETIGPAQSTWDTLHGGIELADAGM